MEQATLTRAKTERKPILLSVGYAACHWCHVMAHESFEEPEIAGLMNQHFINIKVDREERPDIDAVYQQALAVMGQQGGWPLTMFLTPEREPFWGGTYFPPEPRYGRPGFRAGAGAGGRALARAAATRREQPRRHRPGAAAPGGAGAGDAARRRWPGGGAAAGERFDTCWRARRRAEVSPGAAAAADLGHRAARPATRHCASVSSTRSTRSRQGGIYDHLGGGFARYSVDAYWLVPHFEKMLYDNAQLLELLARLGCDARALVRRPRGGDRRLAAARDDGRTGAFAAALDADSEGEEGRFYVWTAGGDRPPAGPDLQPSALAYGVTRAATGKAAMSCNRLHEPGLPEPTEAEAGRARAQILLASRATRIRRDGTTRCWRTGTV